MHYYIYRQKSHHYCAKYYGPYTSIYTSNDIYINIIDTCNRTITTYTSNKMISIKYIPTEILLHCIREKNWD